MSIVHVGLHRGGGLVGWLNRWLTRSRIGHASIRFGDQVFEASMNKGWKFTALADIRGPVTWYTVQVTDEEFGRMYQWCRDRQGWPYDFRSVIKFTALWRLFFPSREARRDRKRLFCFEGVYLCFLENGITLLGEARAWEISGHDLSYSYLLTRVKV